MNSLGDAAQSNRGREFDIMIQTCGTERTTLIRARQPAAALNRYFDLIVYAENRAPSGAVTQFDLLPGPCAWLVFQLGGLLQWSSPVEAMSPERPRLTVTGSHDRPLAAVGLGTTRDISVRIRPEATAALLGIQGAELRRGDLDLGALWGGEWRSFGERLLQTDDADVAIRIVEAMLLRRILAVTPPREEMRLAVETLSRHAGANAVAMASERVGMTSRYLDILFRRHLGMSPKRFARLVRFSRCASAILRPEQDARGHEARLHFFDDSHYIRDFKALAGITPTQLARRLAQGHAPGGSGIEHAGLGSGADASWGQFGPMLVTRR